MNWKDFGLRLMWTVISAVAAVLTVDQIPDMAELESAGTVGLIAAYNFVLLAIRKAAASSITTAP
jgi:hypothetical protein